MERLEIGAPQVGHSKKTVAVMEGSSALLDPRRELPVADPYLHRIPRLNLRGPADDFPGFVGHDGEAPIQHGFRVEGRESLADPGQAGPPDTQEISHPPAGTPGQDVQPLAIGLQVRLDHLKEATGQEMIDLFVAGDATPRAVEGLAGMGVRVRTSEF